MAERDTTHTGDCACLFISLGYDWRCGALQVKVIWIWWFMWAFACDRWAEWDNIVRHMICYDMNTDTIANKMLFNTSNPNIMWMITILTICIDSISMVIYQSISVDVIKIWSNPSLHLIFVCFAGGLLSDHMRRILVIYIDMWTVDWNKAHIKHAAGQDIFLLYLLSRTE